MMEHSFSSGYGQKIQKSRPNHEVLSMTVTHDHAAVIRKCAARLNLSVAALLKHAVHNFLNARLDGQGDWIEQPQNKEDG